MNKLIFGALAVVLLVCAVAADQYMHNPRGSNNKLMEENSNTQNQNRLFDSQNNAEGGYFWGETMTFYSGSLLQVEWTSQHGCGPDSPNVDCNHVLQYMCGPWIRDGNEQGTPNTIGNQNGQTITYDTDDSLLTGSRGQNEPIGFYQACLTRNRNGGLFLADQGINNNIGATATRQNPGGNRHGFECTEERDYYPYWAPTPWKDIAVLTSSTNRCSYYQKNSQNVAKKGICITQGVAPPKMDWSNTSTIPDIWNGQASDWSESACTKNGNQWIQINSWGLDAPECIAPANSRDNHLGNVYITGSVMTNTYKWVLPSVPKDQGEEYATCVFRMRYNITADDYDGFAGWAETGKNKVMIDSSFNGKTNSPVTTNPTITYGVDSDGNSRNLTLNVNTNQYGRTFQDRSHAFYLTKRPDNVAPGARIYNLNVRGRRGNIVQCYPAVEYDFTPNNLHITSADYIHFQWTGSSHNAANQAGSGLDKTDRSNMVALGTKNAVASRNNYPAQVVSTKMVNTQMAMILAHVRQPAICAVGSADTTCCKRYDPNVQNPANDQQNPQNCNYLNLASELFDGGVVRPSSTGTFYFVGTRNNNFTNRSQKSTITVSGLLSPVALTGIAIGSAGFIGAAVVGGGVWYAQNHAGSGAANVFGSIKI